MSFTPHVAELASGPVHYQKGGSGPPILHLHPSAGPRLTPVIAQLAARHSVFVPTAPGFNGTPTHASAKTMRDLAALMGTFAATVIGGKYDIVAESFGGWVALWVAALQPDAVEHLAVQGPAGLRDPGTGGLPADPKERLRALFSKPEHAPAETRTPQVIAETAKVRDAYVGGVDFDAALSAALPQIKARTLVVMGTKDTIAPVIVAHRIKAAVPNAHLSFIYGAAHALEYDAPARVGPLISGFLDRGEAFIVPRKASNADRSDAA
ncbi:MAG: alpha/beta hydrolase [Alphaproteobacteria bacterium]|nr:alpha/beta hydrolase [Alphaproteobacteria bacterium]